MLQSFSLNLLFNNARFYLSPSSGSLGGSRNNSYESLKDTSDIAFSTPRSSPRTPGPETLSSQTTLPSLAPPVATPTTIQASLCVLPFPPSQTSLAPKPDPATPSLLDTSISFARMMDRTGSPASFLTCSSGWDPGIIRGAVMFPSLLHSGPSFDNVHLTQETICIPNDSEAGVGNPPWEAKSPQLSQLSQPPSKVPFAAATPFYLPPSLRNAEPARLQPHDFVASTSPRTVFEPQVPSPTNSKYSPSSEFSPESTTSSIYDDPFHWDTILAGLPPTPQRSPTLAAGEGLSVRVPTLTSPVPSAIQCHATYVHSPKRDSAWFDFATSSGPIPTIVVLGPDSNMVPTQASVSSIIGLYSSQCESIQTATWEVPTPELQVLEGVPEQELYDDDTDGEDSSSESEFEIVAVSALKVRLDTILETDEVDVENAFGSLMTLGSITSGNTRISAAEEKSSTEFLGNGRALPSFSSATEPSIDVSSVFSSGQIIQTDLKVSASTSLASTVRLLYAQSGTSISGESTTSSCHPTASGSESDCPWLFHVEDGKILEVSRSASMHGGGKLADKLARFPNVPKSPLLTPLPSPFASPLPSPSPANRFFFDGSLTAGIPKKKPGGTSLEVGDTGSQFSPCRGRKTAGCSTTFPRRTSTLYQPPASTESSSVTEVSFGGLDVDLELPNNFGSMVSNPLPTDPLPSSRYTTELSTAQNATLGYGRHVRFESADFRTSSTATGPKRYSPHHRRPPLNRSKTCLKKKRRNKAEDWRDSSDASTALVRSPGVDCDHLPSSFSSGSVSKRGSWWRHGRLPIVIGRVRRGIRGCLSLEGEEAFGSPAWATEHDYWNDHLAKGESKRSSDSMGNDGGALLQRIRRCT